MTHPLQTITKGITAKEKDSIDAMARECPEMIQAAWDLCTLVGNVPAQYYIAKHHAKHMPAQTHEYLRKLVTFTELLESDTPLTTSVIVGITLDLYVDSLLFNPKDAGIPREVAVQVGRMKLGLEPSVLPINVDTWIAEHGGVSTVVPVGAEAEEAAKAGGLNIASLVPGNDTKH